MLQRIFCTINYTKSIFMGQVGLFRFNSCASSPFIFQTLFFFFDRFQGQIHEGMKGFWHL